MTKFDLLLPMSLNNEPFDVNSICIQQTHYNKLAFYES